jgi:hypothetical protein
MTMPRPINMSVDNLARAQRIMLSTAEPGTPLVLRECLRGNHPTRNTRTAAYQPHGVHLNSAVRLSKGWGPPLIHYCTMTKMWPNSSSLSDQKTILPASKPQLS